MWNWRGEERYPDGCLVAVGEVLKGRAVRGGEGYRRLYWIVLGIAAGAGVVGWGGYVLWRRLTMGGGEDRARGEETANGEEKQMLEVEMGSAGGGKKRRGGGGRKKKAGVLVLGLFGSRAAAYTCVGRAPAHEQFFTLAAPGGLISGVVHGWFAECFDRRVCWDVCDWKGKGCTGSGTGRKCKQSCHQVCNIMTEVVWTPRDFVGRVMSKVEACGFEAVDVLKSGVDIGKRVANSGLEKKHWVRISVSGLNVTRETETDGSIRCLHAIGDQ